MTRQRPGQSEEAGDRSSGCEVAADILATAVLRLLQAGGRPISAGPGGGETARSLALLSPPHRASMSGARGAQKPPAKEDKHG